MTKELEIAEKQTKNNNALTLYMCADYDDRVGAVDTAKEIARQTVTGEFSEYDLAEESFA